MNTTSTVTAGMQDTPRILTDANFAELVERQRGVALVDFGAEWCPPCRMMKPVMKQIAAQYAGRAMIGMVEVDENQVTATRYNARSLPTFLFFIDGELAAGIVGAVPATRLTDKLDELLAQVARQRDAGGRDERAS